MRIRRKLLMAACLAVVPGMAVTATAAAGTAAAGGHHTDGRAAGRAARHRPAAHRARVALSGLSAQQLAGQRVIYSYPGLTPPASLISLIEHGEAAGVIFFGQNISSEPQIAGVIKKLDQADASSLNPVRAPLLLMTDQEGGEVRRLPGRPYLSEKEIGANPLPQAEKLATEAGQGAAANLHGVGMNVNLAPVLDVYRKAGDFDDQYGRSYSMNPTVVSDLGTRMLRAQQGAGVAAAVKHFPGLGAATKNQDTDVRPVTLNLSLNTLRTVDEVPFAAAVQAGVKMVMVSWAIYPALGARPAGFSSNVVQGELRDRLHFTGVTITDALEAGALNPFGSIQHRALRAALAGMDLLLASGQSVTEGQQAAGELAAAYSSGALGQASFQAAVNRVIALRQSL